MVKNALPKKLFLLQSSLLASDKFSDYPIVNPLLNTAHSMVSGQKSMLHARILTVSYGFILLVGQDPLLPTMISLRREILLLDLELLLWIKLHFIFIRHI